MARYLWLYAQAVGMFIMTIFVFCFLAPVLISANSTFIMLVGFVVLAALFAGIGVFIMHVVDVLNNLKKEKEDEKVSNSRRRSF